MRRSFSRHALPRDSPFPNMAGEPDERTQHEGVAPTAGTKYAINGWMRSKRRGRAGFNLV